MDGRAQGIIDDAADPLEVYLHDLSNKSEARLPLAYNLAPGLQGGVPVLGLAISGDIIAWPDTRSDQWEIYGYDISLSKEFSISTNQGNAYTVSMREDLVAWSYHRGGDFFSGEGEYDLSGYDLSAQSETPICTYNGQRSFPAISRGIVLWADGRRPDTGTDIYGCDLATGEEFVLVHGSGFRHGLRSIGDVVVWVHQEEDRSDQDIHAYNLSTETPFSVVVHENIQTSPDIDGGLVVWEDWRAAEEPAHHQIDIYGYELATGEEIVIRACEAIERVLRISGNTVIWIVGGALYGARLSRSEEIGTIEPCPPDDRINEVPVETR